MWHMKENGYSYNFWFFFTLGLVWLLERVESQFKGLSHLLIAGSIYSIYLKHQHIQNGFGNRRKNHLQYLWNETSLFQHQFYHGALATILLNCLFYDPRPISPHWANRVWCQLQNGSFWSWSGCSRHTFFLIWNVIIQILKIAN